MTTAEVWEQALKLPPEEQMKLAHELWIAANGPYDEPVEVEDEWAGEIASRLQGIVDGTEVGIPDDEVRGRLGL